MTREELIEQEAQRLGQMYFPDERNIWARPNYEAQFVSEACTQMANWMQKFMIERACKRLEGILRIYAESLPTAAVVDSFRKAMEE